MTTPALLSTNCIFCLFPCDIHGKEWRECGAATSRKERHIAKLFEFAPDHKVHAELPRPRRRKVVLSLEQQEKAKERREKKREQHQNQLAEQTRKNKLKEQIKEDGRMVFTNILLGGLKVAANTPRLKSLNVVAIVNCTGKDSGHHEDKSLAHFQVNVADSSDANIGQYFESASAFIAENCQKGKVLIHCQEGASRSPTVFMAHLIHAHNMSYHEALEILHTKYGEEFVSMNRGFVKQLKELEQKSLGINSETPEKRESKPSQRFLESPKKRPRSKSGDALLVGSAKEPKKDNLSVAEPELKPTQEPKKEDTQEERMEVSS